MQTVRCLLLLGLASHLLAATEAAAGGPGDWPAAVTDYRDLLNKLSKNTTDWAIKARAIRQWMAENDPDYPIYHLAAPEGW